MKPRTIAPGEWGDMPSRPSDRGSYFAPIPVTKPAPPVHPHTSFGRSYCNGRCCGKPTCHVTGADGKPVRLEYEKSDDGAYVLELDEHRKPMAAPYDEKFHDGWARYALHVCKAEDQ